MPRLRLKTKLVLAITAMVLALVVTLSWIYVSQLMRQRVQETYQSADFVAHQILTGARQALEIDLESTRIDLTCGMVEPPSRGRFRRPDRTSAPHG